jgi:thiol:disulfide interchange protein
MRNSLRLALCFLFLGITTLQILSANEQKFDNPVTVEIMNEQETIQPGRPFWIAVRFNIDTLWHAYWKNPGSAGMAPTIDWSLPEGFTVEQLLWPTPNRFFIGSAVSFGYEKELVLLAQIQPSANYGKNDAEIKADLRWVVCSDSNCLPGDAQLQITIPVKNQIPQVNAAFTSQFQAARSQIPNKEIAVEVQRKGELIELNIAAPAALQSTPITGADFFSEQKEVLNDSQQPLIQQNSTAPERYTLLLQENKKVSSLKGVLVLKTNQTVHSFELDLPIESPSVSEGENDVVEISKPLLEKGVLDEAGVATKQNAFAFEGSLSFALLLAFAGGIILNLMPCVLPVISFKILGFVKLAGESRKLIFKHGAAFSFGVILSFWVLAGILLILQAYGRSIGWGFQLQEPIFVAILAAFLFIFGLSLFGLFEIGTTFISAANQAHKITNQRSALTGSFFSGILATIVATPCTGPFLGSAIGFALTLPPSDTMLIFTAIGIGMSAPYLALAAFPSLLRFMPRAGSWMIAFKELMGFLMMATVLWLLWVFGAQTSIIAVDLLLAAFLLLAIGGWIYGRWSTLMNKKTVRSFGLFGASVFFAAGIYIVVLAASSWTETLGGTSSIQSQVVEGWETFSPERVAELRQKGVPVFIDFTAKWCLICQANHLVLSTEETSQMFKKLGVVKMKADWTKNDRIITDALREFGRSSVPLYVLYGPDLEAHPRLLPQVLTSDVILTELKQIERVLVK